MMVRSMKMNASTILDMLMIDAAIGYNYKCFKKNCPIKTVKHLRTGIAGAFPVGFAERQCLVCCEVFQ
jgi:hypothetical protein